MGGFRKVGLTACTALVLANMIGTGVFTSLGFQVKDLHSPFLILLVWTLGGVVAFCGALSYAELAATYPRSGGEYNFLTQAYHPALGFMAGFISVTVGFAAPIALAALAFGRYFSGALPGFPPVTASVGVVLCMAAVHSCTVHASGSFQIVITTLKVALIVTFIGLGFWKGFDTPAEFAPQPGDGAQVFGSSFAIALMFVLYSYSGWNAAAYIMNEVRDPQKTVPRALLQATLLVTVLYVALNATFLGSGPLAGFVGKLEVGEIAAKNLLGEDGGRVMSGLISLGLISAISAMTWAGPRVGQTIGRDFPVLGFLSCTSAGGVPRLAIGLQTILVVLMLALSTFEVILVFAQCAILACSFLTVLGVMVSRWRWPGLPRPFRCWGYPVTPVIFLTLNLFALVYTAKEKPHQAGASLLTLLAGIGLYFLAKRASIRR